MKITPSQFCRSARRFWSPIPFALTVGCAASFAGNPASAQVPEHAREIEGIIRDARTQDPLAGSTVFLMGTRTIAVTHQDGSFHLVGVEAGTHFIRVERLGYRSEVVEVSLGPESGLVIVELHPSPISIHGMVVTAALTERGANEVLRPANVMAGDEMQYRLRGTVAETLALEPGLAATSTGPATARPVIRGLSGDRVLMLEDGARVGDVSNSGADHATAITPFAARRIEVVRGPSALLYGSNALGGVINVIRDEIPSSVPHHPTGSALLRTRTVSGSVVGSAAATFGVTNRIPLRLEATARTADDLDTPVGRLQNTDSEVLSGGAGTAYVSDWGHAGASFRAYRNKYGIPGGFVGGHVAGVRVEMERMSTKFRAVVDRPIGPFASVEADGTYTWYRHKELEPPDILGTLFKLQTLSGDILARHGAQGPFSAGAVGARISWEDFGFGGSLSTPNARRNTAAAYIFEEIDLDPVRIEAGLRYDWVQARPLQKDPESDIGAIRDRVFQAASASFGLLYRAGSFVTAGVSVARAFRTPDIHELYSQGPHLAAYSFEVGNPSLNTEVGTGLDLFVRLGSDRMNAELNGFYNRISGYIYGEQTGQVSRVLLPVYQFRGNNAHLAGLEGSVNVDAGGGLLVQGVASFVQGSLTETGDPLPLIPPLQGLAAVEYDRPTFFLRTEAELAARQNRIGAFESQTEGYAVFHIAGGARLTVAGRLNVLTLSLENLTNKEYRNHLSRIKELMPEAGRGLSATYRIVF